MITQSQYELAPRYDSGVETKVHRIFLEGLEFDDSSTITSIARLVAANGEVWS